MYPRSRFSDARDPYQAAVSRAWGDARLVCPTYDVAARAAAAGLPVHMYNFDVPLNDVLGASHAAEIAFVFGTLLDLNSQTPQPWLPVSDRLQAYWTNFAKTGDPNDGSLLSWPALTPQDNVRINFGLEESSLVNDFRAEECAFWGARFDAAFQQP
jgi:para-nitrobenzyl esterase